MKNNLADFVRGRILDDEEAELVQKEAERQDRWYRRLLRRKRQEDGWNLDYAEDERSLLDYLFGIPAVIYEGVRKLFGGKRNLR